MDISFIIWMAACIIIFMSIGAIRIARRCNESIGKAVIHEMIGIAIVLLFMILWDLIVG
ncbi:MAG: hypothetical protein PUB10_04370 [Clostridiales bacterium]|nr:hypothetical protein [Clostridiales bacterium]